MVSGRSTATLAERKQSEQDLRESEERFRALVKGVKDYAIFMLDPDGRVLTWNDGAERIKGYRPDEIIGKHFSCFYPKEDVERGKPDQGLRVAKIEGRFEEEGQRVRKDGSLFWANVVITALRDDAGNLRAFTKVTRDITERKRAEEELVKTQHELEKKVEQRTASLAAEVAQRIQSEEILQRRESWLRSLIFTTQDAVVSIDRRGCVVLFNLRLSGLLVIPRKRLLAVRSTSSWPSLTLPSTTNISNVMNERVKPTRSAVFAS